MTILTLTHARIRAAQGDTAGARRVLRSLLERQPEHREARELLALLAGARSTDVPRETEERSEAPRAAEAGDLAETFRRALGRRDHRPDCGERRRRLERWLARIGADRPRPPGPR